MLLHTLLLVLLLMGVPFSPHSPAAAAAAAGEPRLSRRRLPAAAAPAVVDGSTARLALLLLLLLALLLLVVMLPPGSSVGASRSVNRSCVIVANGGAVHMACLGCVSRIGCLVLTPCCTNIQPTNRLKE